MSMSDEKIADAHVKENDLTGQPEFNEKTAEANLREHEPYDATALNINLGEFPMHPTPRGDHTQNSLKEELLEEEALDLFKPFPIDPTIAIEDHILTFRAVITGIVLGCLVNASNLYLGTCLIFSF